MFKVLILITILLTACGKKEKSGDTPITRVDPQEVESVDEFALNLKLDSDIPEYVGQIISYTEDEKTGLDIIGTCTGNLIESNVILTNRHCIHGSFLSDANRCNKDFRIVFRDNSKHYVRSCKKVISASRDASKSDADFAIIELTESVPLNPIEIDVKGIDNNKEITVNAVNMFPNNTTQSYESRLRVSRCKTKFNSLFDYVLSEDIVVTLIARSKFSKCDVISGNSGSAMIDSVSGKAVGVVQSIIEYDDIPTDSAEGQILKSFIREVKKVVFGTNLNRITYFNKAIKNFSSQERFMAEQRIDWEVTKNKIKENFFISGNYDQSIEIFDFNFEGEDFYKTVLEQNSYAAVSVYPKCILSWLTLDDLPDRIDIAKANADEVRLSVSYELEPVFESFSAPSSVEERTAILKTDSTGFYYEYDSFDGAGGVNEKIRTCQQED